MLKNLKSQTYFIVIITLIVLSVLIYYLNKNEKISIHMSSNLDSCNKQCGKQCRGGKCYDRGRGIRCDCDDYY